MLAYSKPSLTIVSDAHHDSGSLGTAGVHLHQAADVVALAPPEFGACAREGVRCGVLEADPGREIVHLGGGPRGDGGGDLSVKSRRP
eukprot:55618-Prorocentrum_minimum.AAC.4